MDYQKELDALEEIIRRIEYILGNRTTYPKHVQDIKDRIHEYREKIMQLMNTIDQIHGNLNNTDSRMKDANDEVFKLRNIYEQLRVLGNSVLEQLRNFTLVKGPGNALNKTIRSLEVSNQALDISREVRQILAMSSEHRATMNRKLATYKENNDKIVNKLTIYPNQLRGLEDIVAAINRDLCGVDASVCGGCKLSGCDTCGGEGCGGAVPQAMRALEKAKEAERAFWQKERKFRNGITSNY